MPLAAPAFAPLNNLSLDASLGILPSVPDDASLLAQLKANASLKVSQPTVILAVRAALAERCGYFQIPTLLVDRMEQYAELLDEPVGEDFYKLRKLISQRNYAEIYEGMPGMDGNFVSQKRRDAFLKRLDTLLWPALLSFQSQLKAWGESWQQGMMNPATTMALLFGGGAGHALPPGMMQPPPTDSLRDAADAVNIQINKVFAGVGVPVAMALGYDCAEDQRGARQPRRCPPRSARPIGIRCSGCSMSPSRRTTPGWRRTWSATCSRSCSIRPSPPDAELGFLTALTMLGGQIPWDKLIAADAHRPPQRHQLLDDSADRDCA